MRAVTFDRVSKKYRLRHKRGGDEFWAVRDISFDVARGETLGVIGHNGAGKSTLLKLLSRITAPTEGTITLEGRLAALIEVGSGFHPELSGRENIFLSGAVLGMRRKEIAAKLDRIIEFSGVAPFIDMPVKWYSSGMYVRLGFAVAAHLEADILLVDEVLAVGDAAFQLRCFERIGELRREGATLLFISHDLSSIARLCDRVMLMESGRIRSAGTPAGVIAEYQQLVTDAFPAETADAQIVAAQDSVRVAGVSFRAEDGGEIHGTTTGGWLTSVVDLDVTRPISDAVVEVYYYSRDGRVLHCQQSTAVRQQPVLLEPGRRRLEFTCPEMGLQPGVYSVGASVRTFNSPGALDWWYGTTLLYVEPGKSVRGYFYSPHDWRWADVAAAKAERRAADI